MTRNLTATVAFVAVAVGFWLAWQPLGLIVPGSLVLAALVYSHLRGEVVTEKQQETQTDA